MPVKLFIVGLPGSGKSEIARHITKYVRHKLWPNTDKLWFTTRFNDYPILYTMYKDDNEHKCFMHAESGGFNAIDFSVCDDALKSLGQWVTWHISSKQAQQEEIILIEFARNDYGKAFHQFKQSFLQDGYFIYLGADVKVCKQRISERVAKPRFEEDDYPVSDSLFQAYYHSDDGSFFSQILAQDLGINVQQQVLEFDNNCSLEEAVKKIDPFIDHIINLETSHHMIVDSSTESSCTTTPEKQPELSSSKPAYLAEDKEYQFAGYPTR